MLVYSANPPGNTAAQIIQATLQSIGIKMDIQIIEFGTETPLLNAGKFDVDYMRWTWPDPVIESLLFKTPGWTKQLSDPDLDKLLTVADTTLDPEKRVVANHAVQQYILQKAYIAPIATDWIALFAEGTGDTAYIVVKSHRGIHEIGIVWPAAADRPMLKHGRACGKEPTRFPPACCGMWTAR